MFFSLQGFSVSFRVLERNALTRVVLTGFPFKEKVVCFVTFCVFLLAW